MKTIIITFAVVGALFVAIDCLVTIYATEIGNYVWDDRINE